MKRLLFYYSRYPHEILRMRMRMRMSKFMRISADADPDAELRYTSSFNEEIWLNDCPDYFKPVFYARYIDDTFVLFKDRSPSKLFLDYLNSKHNNI